MPPHTQTGNTTSPGGSESSNRSKRETEKGRKGKKDARRHGGREEASNGERQFQKPA